MMPSEDDFANFSVVHAHVSRQLAQFIGPLTRGAMSQKYIMKGLRIGEYLDVQISLVEKSKRTYIWLVIKERSTKITLKNMTKS